MPIFSHFAVLLTKWTPNSDCANTKDRRFIGGPWLNYRALGLLDTFCHGGEGEIPLSRISNHQRKNPLSGVSALMAERVRFLLPRRSGLGAPAPSLAPPPESGFLGLAIQGKSSDTLRISRISNHQRKNPLSGVSALMAERVRFELTVPFRVQRFSRPSLSTAQAPLHDPFGRASMFSFFR